MGLRDLKWFSGSQGFKMAMSILYAHRVKNISLFLIFCFFLVKMNPGYFCIFAINFKYAKGKKYAMMYAQLL